MMILVVAEREEGDNLVDNIDYLQVTQGNMGSFVIIKVMKSNINVF